MRSSDNTVRALVGQYRTYELRVGGTRIPWEIVQPLLRAALEADLPVHQRSQEARDLAEFLHAERPTRVQYVLARGRLMQIWQNLRAR